MTKAAKTSSQNERRANGLVSFSFQRDHRAPFNRLAAHLQDFFGAACRYGFEPQPNYNSGELLARFGVGRARKEFITARDNSEAIGPLPAAYHRPAILEFPCKFCNRLRQIISETIRLDVLTPRDQRMLGSDNFCFSDEIAVKLSAIEQAYEKVIVRVRGRDLKRPEIGKGLFAVAFYKPSQNVRVRDGDQGTDEGRDEDDFFPIHHALPLLINFPMCVLQAYRIERPWTARIGSGPTQHGIFGKNLSAHGEAEGVGHA